MAELGVEAEFAIEEPSLRYHRLGNDCPKCYETNDITCFGAHYKFIVLGHKNGEVNIFDHLGYRVQSGSYKKHFRPVNQISISEDGNFVASCADDGFAYIYNLMEPEQSELINLSKPIKSIAISPKYSLTKKIIIADKKISLYSRGLFGRRTSEELYVPPGDVEAMSWRGNILIWADEYAVRVYNVRRKQLINFIPKTETNASSTLEDRPRCHLSWHSDTCFLIGWEKTVQVCHIISPPSNDHSTTGDVFWTSTASNDDAESVASNSTLNSAFLISSVRAVREYVQLTVQFSLQREGNDEKNGDVIYGIASHQGRILALLYSPRSFASLLNAKEVTEATEEILSVEKSPQLVVLEIGEALTAAPYSTMMSDLDSVLDVSEEDAFEEISREDVEVKMPPGLQGLGLATIPGEDIHFVYSLTDLICAESLSADDRIDWFLRQGIPRRALQIAREHQNDLVKHSPKKLGMDCLNKLLEEKNYTLAAGICNLILTDKESWEEQIYRFLHLGQLHVLVPFLPSNKELISSSTYLVILIDLLSKSPKMFLQKVNDWQPGLYPIDPLIAAVKEKTASFSNQDIFAIVNKNQDVHALFRSLILLYGSSDEPEKGLEISIQLKDVGVFDLLRRHFLPQDQIDSRFSSVVRRQIIPLCQIDTPRAISLLIDCMQELPVEFVVQELESQPQILFKYLDALHMRNPRAALPHIHRLVKLYASYAREQLLPFLRSTHQYPLNEALELCKSLNYIPETVYLLTRVGRRKDALKLLMEKGADDTFLLGSCQLTSEQRQAEVAAQAIAYCLEEDTSLNSEGVTYLTSYDYPHRPHRIHRRQKTLIGSETSPLDSDENSDAESGDEDEDAEVAQNRSLPTSLETGELWRQVVLFAVDKPGFICALLKHASTEKIDPVLLLRKITPNMEIPNLKESLVNLLRNTQMQIELRKNCEAILLKDLQDVSARLVQIQNRGIFVDVGQQQTGKQVSLIGSSVANRGVCKVCRQSLLSTIQSAGPSTSIANAELKGVGQLHQPPLVVFRCSHVFHKSCVFKRSSARLVIACPVCVQHHVLAAAS